KHTLMQFLCVYFFFQAEDGIRDFHVTGVQTCALPISIRFIGQAIEHEARRQIDILEEGGVIEQETRLFDPEKGVTRSMRTKEEEIGRASCRERVWSSVVAEPVESETKEEIEPEKYK